jgi:predicted Zn-dependent protease
MSATMLAFLRSSCRGMGVQPRHLDDPSAVEDPLKAVLEEAISLREEQRPELSLELLEIARSAGLSSDWIEDNRARALLALGRLEEAQVLLEALRGSAIEAVAEAAQAQLAEPNDADQELGTELSQEQHQALTALLEQAIALRQENQVEASLALLDQALADGHSSPWLQDNRARALVNLGRRLEAEALWRTLTTDPDEAVAAMANAMASQLRAAVLDDLLWAANQAFAEHRWTPRFLRPALPSLEAAEEAVLQEAIASREADRHELSLALLNKALELGFPSPWLKDNQARALVNLGRRREAVALWEELSAVDDDALRGVASDLAAEQRRQLIQELQQQLGWTAAEQGIPLQWVPHSFETVAAFEEAILKDAIAAREAGNAKGSLALLDAAYAAGFTSGWLQDNRARALVHLQRTVEAVAIWRTIPADQDEPLARAIAEMMDLFGREADREATTQRVDALVADHQPDAAVQLLTEAILQDPDWDGWQEALKRVVAEQEQPDSPGEDLLRVELREPQLALRAFEAFLRAVEQRQAKAVV